MTARRTEIRNALAAALTGLATTGARVFVSRTRALGASELPAILVFSGEEQPDGSMLANGRPLVRVWQLRADILVKENDTAETTADDILSQIEAKLFASPASMTLSGQVMSLRLAGVGSAELDDTTEKPAVRLPVVLEVKYK